MLELKTRAAYPILLVGAAIWCGGIVLAPVAAAMGSAGLSHGLYAFFGTICHQFDSRSLHIDGYKFAVCARCSAIYFNFLLGLVMNPLFPDLRKLPFRLALAVAVLPMLIDVGLGMTGLHEPTIVTRVVTGAWFGFIISHLILGLFDEALFELMHPEPAHPSDATHVPQA